MDNLNLGQHLEYSFLYLCSIRYAGSMSVLRKEYGKLSRLAGNVCIGHTFILGNILNRVVFRIRKTAQRRISIRLFNL